MILTSYVNWGLFVCCGLLNTGLTVPNLRSSFFKSSDDRFDADRLFNTLNFAYHLEISPLNKYTQGEFELGISLRLLKGK